MRWLAIRLALIIALLMLAIMASHRAHAQNSTVANMNPAATLTGPELFYCVQNGQDRKCTGTQITALLTGGATGYLYANGSGSPTFSTTIPGTAITANSLPGSALLAGTITGTAIASNTIANANLALMAASTIKCNPNGSSHAPVDCTGAQAAAIIGAQAALRLANATNFYVATTGSDANTCLSLVSPCLTLPHVLGLVLGGYDLQGNNAVINLGAGVFPIGALVDGSPVGAASNSGFPAVIEIIGAGSGASSIYTYGGGGPGTHTGGQCTGLGSQPYPLILDRATVLLGSITLESSCQGAATIFASDYSYVGFVNSDVVLFSEYSGLNSVAEAYNFSTFNADYPITIEGNATYGIDLSSHSNGFFNASSVDGNYQVTGNYASAWMIAFDGSFFNCCSNGSLFNVIGAVNGPSYQLNINSFVDAEQVTTPLPGNAPGLIEMGSTYYASTASTTSVASHSVGSASMVAGSGDHSGGVLIAANTHASGTVVLQMMSQNYGSTGGGGFCTVSFDSGSTDWLPKSPLPLESSYSTANAQLTINWQTGSTLGSGNYGIDYTCP